MRCLRIVIFATALAVATPSVHAQTPMPPSAESLEAARDLFTVIFEHAFGSLNAQAVDGTWPGIEAAIRAQNPQVDAATLAELRREFERIRLSRMYEVTKDLPTVYARLLTQDEIRDIAAFYRTPSGIKMLHALPRIMIEGFAITLPRMQVITGDTNAEFLTLLRERGLL
jgi:hypothetical protein